MPQFVMTNYCSAAFVSASLGGPKVDISRFRVANVVGAWTPAPTDTDLPSGIITGNGILDPNGFMPVVNYKIVAEDTGAYALRMNNDIGTFDFNSVAMYQEDPPSSGTYVCVGLYRFPDDIKKQAATMTDLGNVIEISAHITVSNISNLTVTNNIVTPSPANIFEQASPDFLGVPSTSPVDVYITNNDSILNPGTPHGLDEEGNAIIAYKKSSDIWTFGTHLHKIVNGGTVADTSTPGIVNNPTTTSFGSLSIDSLLFTMNLGQYIVQMTSGAFIGESRVVTASPVLNEITWATAMPGIPAVGDTFDIYQSNVSWGGGGGGSGGQNEWQVTIASPLQTLFNTAPVRAAQALVFFGSAFQPPDPTVYSVIGPFTIQFVTGVPGGTRVHFIERTLDFNNVIDGGTAGQALVKNSATNGDYTWQTLGFDTHPIVQGIRRAAQCFPYAVSTSASATMGATLASTGRWHGAVQTVLGKIYCIPHNSDKIAVIDPYLGTADDSIDLGAGLTPGVANWAGGVLAPNGMIVGIPYNATTILSILPESTMFYSNGLALNGIITGTPIPGTGKYIGGVLAPNGKIYCVPHNATQVLIIDPLALTYTLMAGAIAGSAKYAGGCLSTFNGKIYCAPHDATDILVIDPSTDTWTQVASGLPAGSSKWYGICHGADGYLYAIPSSSTDILRIDPSTDTTSVVSPALPATPNKYQGGCVGPDGKIYCAPYDSADYLVIDTLQQSWTAYAMGATGTNKFSGLVHAVDGQLYGVPYSVTNGFLQVRNYMAPALGFDLTLSPYLNKF